MRARRIYDDPQRQREHCKRFADVQKLVFGPGGRRAALKTVADHPGRAVADAILDVTSKMDVLDEDFRSLRSAVDEFWEGAFAPRSTHASYCRLQMEVWRAAFHIAASAQSVSETVKATMRKYSRPRKAAGRATYLYWVCGFDARWDALEMSPIYKFNHCLRGALYHVRLSNPDWIGYKDLAAGRQKERFLLSQEELLRLAERDPKARAYIRAHAINVRGSRSREGQETFGVDLVAHYQRYRAVLRKLCRWIVSQLEDPRFGTQQGRPPHALDEYLDLERACQGVSRRWKRCRHCGRWSSR
jgi:hypothetical protein